MKDAEIVKPKKRKVKIKPAHRNVLANLMESGGNKYKAIKDAGYSHGLANTPDKVLESKSFQQLLEEQGLTDDYLNDCLRDDIEAKKANRLGELTLAYKLKGKLTDKQEGNKTLIINISGQSADRYKHIDS